MFTAFTVPTTTNAVSSAPWAGSSANWPPPGSGKRKYWIPLRIRKPAASTWPPSLVSASSSKRSSRVPIAQIMAPAMSTILASWKTKGWLRDRNGSCWPTTKAASRPPSIARPPR